MAYQNVVVLGGSGNVGREFMSQVIQQDTGFSKKHLNPTNVIALTDSKGFWFNRHGLKIQENPEDIPKWRDSKDEFKEYMQGLDEYNQYDNLSDLLKLIKDEGMAGEIAFVDITAGKDDLRDFHLKVINDSEETIITANKNPSPYTQLMYSARLPDTEKDMGSSARLWPEQMRSLIYWTITILRK